MRFHVGNDTKISDFLHFFKYGIELRWLCVCICASLLETIRGVDTFYAQSLNMYVEGYEYIHETHETHDPFTRNNAAFLSSYFSP